MLPALKKQKQKNNKKRDKNSKNNTHTKLFYELYDETKKSWLTFRKNSSKSREVDRICNIKKIILWNWGWNRRKVYQVEEGLMKPAFFQILYLLTKKIIITMIYLKCMSCYNRIWIQPNEKSSIILFMLSSLDQAIEINFKPAGGDRTNTTARQCFCLSLWFKFISH